MQNANKAYKGKCVSKYVYRQTDRLIVLISLSNLRKQLWDYVNVIESSVNHWRTTSWLKLDIDDIENYCKQFTRDLRSLDKGIRDWAPYLYIIRLLKELNSSFRTVTELQNPALTERHWMEMMTELKVRLSGLDQDF